jgi:methylglutaconyl-CoA hydratase
MSLVTYTAADRIGTITLNRPEKRNALNQEMVDALKQAFAKAAADPEAKVIVLRAQGEAFCAGADLGYMQQLQKFSYEENLADSLNLMELYHLIYTTPKLVIACVEGHALAGGSGLVTVCDMAYAVPEAKLGYTEVRIGFIPALVSTFLVRKIGEGKARDLLFTGRIILAAEAASLGMISRVVPRETMNAELKVLTDQLLTNASAQSLAATKKLLEQVQDLPLREALELAARENAAARGTEDCKRGIAAFLEKKDLRW